MKYLTDTIVSEYWEVFLATFVATFEIICRVLVMIGLLTRLSSIPLLIIMTTALVTIKIPILLNKGFCTMAHD